MSTLKFQKPSPYLEEKRKHHPTDFVYDQFEQDAGLSKEKSKPECGDTMNIAIFGMGRAGSIHVRNALRHANINLKYVVEPNLETVQRLKKCFPQCNFRQASSEEVFADKSIEMVIIATPTFLHDELVEGALRAHKSVFCEKPISTSSEKTTELYNLSEKVGCSLICAFNRRFDPSFKELKSRVENGEVGQLHLVKSVARDSPLPSIEYLKISGGIFHDCIVHDIDLLCWILGEYPIEVNAMGHSFIPEIKALGDYDTVALTMKFPSGALAMIDVSRDAVYGYDQRLEVFGPKGMMNAHNTRPSVVTSSTIQGTTQNPIYHSFASRYERAYQVELDHAYNVTRGKEELVITEEVVRKVSQIADTLEKSAKEGIRLSMEY